jgi:signal transduction histidine kinase
MTPRSWFVINIGALIVGVLLLGGSAVYGLLGLGRYFEASQDQYERLRQVYETGQSAATARQLLRSEGVDRAAVFEAVSRSRQLAMEAGMDRAVVDRLGEAIELVDGPDAAGSVAQRINSVLSEVADVAQRIKAEIIANRQAASDHLAMLVMVMSGLCAGVVVIAVGLGVGQYRLARRLAESQRLASVGYLAAGVAHEINNPLAIISGYAEAQLGRGEGRGEAVGEGTRRALGIIAQEAFRCKHITSQLLSLAQPAGVMARRVDVGAMVKDLGAAAAALPQLADRQVEMVCGEGRLMVMGDETQLRQVVLNLLTNAGQATEAGTGRIEVRAELRGGWVVVGVKDNGRGMTARVQGRVFEPFFTETAGGGERGDRGAGLGLGLAVSLAIAQRHGGRLTGRSEGLGLGAEFVLEIPAAGAGAEEGGDA